jgi:hypothetical protein
MKNKTITTIFLTSILTVMWCSAAWAADRFNTRDNRQTRRIHQGIHSGKITRPEVHYLKKEQRRIDHAYDRALADGYLNRHERWRLNKMQNRASRHIYRAKHNCAHRCRGIVYSHEKDYFDGYALSIGVSDMGWQFGFSARNSH